MERVQRCILGSVLPVRAKGNKGTRVHQLEARPHECEEILAQTYKALRIFYIHNGVLVGLE